MRVQVNGLLALAAALLSTPAPSAAGILAPPVPPGEAVRPYVRIPAGKIVLRNARLIDGTGSPARPDMTIVLDNDKIVGIGDRSLPSPAGATDIDLSGKTVIPGLVGMHDHLFYIARPDFDASGQSQPPQLAPQMTFSAPRLYLANGVTTIRTAGSVEPYADLNLKARIDAGELPGPHIDVTGPYIGDSPRFLQMHRLVDPEDARRMVAFWADQGVTSFKAYTYITRAELRAAISEAHRRGLKITGHLCSVTYPEAIRMGIDNLEHGFFVNTELDPGKVADVCPATEGSPTLAAMRPDSREAGDLIRLLVASKVALTSTLPVFEQLLPGAPINQKALDAMAPQTREAYLYARNLRNSVPRDRFSSLSQNFANDVALERMFVQAGGLLMAGPDPTGNGGVVPGFGDLRGVELLVGAGFTAEQAIQIASLNGAKFMGLADHIGSVEVGKSADIVVIGGDPSANITDIENVEIVFKDGVGFDPQLLLDSVRNRYGLY